MQKSTTSYQEGAFLVRQHLQLLLQPFITSKSFRIREFPPSIFRSCSIIQPDTAPASPPFPQGCDTLSHPPQGVKVNLYRIFAYWEFVRFSTLATEAAHRARATRVFVQDHNSKEARRGNDADRYRQYQPASQLRAADRSVHHVSLHDENGKQLLANAVFGVAMEGFDVDNGFLVAVVGFHSPASEIKAEDRLGGKLHGIVQVGEKYGDLAIGTD